MAVTSANVKWVDGTERGIGGAIRDYTADWVVITDDPDDGPQTIVASALLPDIGDGYVYGNDSDSSALCFDINPVRRRTTRTVWDVRVEYSNDPGTTEVGEASNPILRPIRYSGGGSSFRELIDRDVVDGSLIKNSAGDPLPPLESDSSVGVLRAHRNEGAQNWGAWVTYHNAVNSDVVLGVFPATTIKMVDIAVGLPQTESGITYFEHVYVMQYKRTGWREPVPDRGLRAKDETFVGPPAAPVRDIIDDVGVKVRTPRPLDGNGFKEGTAVGSGGSGNTNVFLKGGGVVVNDASLQGDAKDGVRKHKEIPFAPLNLGP